eukprot:14031217-Heterocapsa_arctica.AAC.1
MAEQFDLLIAAKAKGEASACGMLMPLFCENDLVVKATNAEAKKGHVHPEVLQEAVEARALANSLREGDSCKDGDTTCATSLVYQSTNTHTHTTIM